jgi:hypothetical protein
VKRLKFVWVDDQEHKVDAYRAVIEAGIGSLRAAVETIEVRRDVLETLEKWVAGRKSAPPDLFIVDHVFNLALPFGLKGSSVAHLLRSAFPATPIVCVTAMFDQPHSFDQENVSAYSALFLFQRLEEHIEDLYAIARDFPKLDPKSAHVRDHLVAALKAPKRDQEDILRILPEEFQEKDLETTRHRIARWIFNTLLRRPGFLYDRLHAATLLGLTESGLKKVQARFAKALYRGVFETDTHPLWWVSMLRKLLLDMSAEGASDLPQHLGRRLQGIEPDDFSVCYITKKVEPPPDAVVDADATRGAKQRVVRREYSDQHPNDPGIMAGFETRLILKKTSK